MMPTRLRDRPAHAPTTALHGRVDALDDRQARLARPEDDVGLQDEVALARERPWCCSSRAPTARRSDARRPTASRTCTRSSGTSYPARSRPGSRAPLAAAGPCRVLYSTISLRLHANVDWNGLVSVTWRARGERRVRRRRGPASRRSVCDDVGVDVGVSALSRGRSTLLSSQIAAARPRRRRQHGRSPTSSTSTPKRLTIQRLVEIDRTRLRDRGATSDGAPDRRRRSSVASRAIRPACTSQMSNLS